MTPISTDTKIIFWPIVTITVVMTMLMVFFSCYFEKDRLKTSMSDNMDKTIYWMSIFAKEAIRHHNYQRIEHMARKLGEEDVEIMLLQVKVPGDFVIAEYKREFSSDESQKKTKEFNYGYHGSFSVFLHQDSSNLKKDFSWHVITIAFFAIAFNAALILVYSILFHFQDKEFYRQLAQADGLTQLASRHYFNETLPAEWKRAARNNTYLSLLFIDIDHFKKINDKYGHLAGDVALQQTAGVILNSLRRPADFAARYGGEEFTVILPETELEGAASIAEQLRQSVQNLQISHNGDTVIDPITISIGVATIRPNQNNTADDLLRAADEMLYMAKKKGRNTCSFLEIS